MLERKKIIKVENKKKKEIFDIIILGAGPAGLSCALELGKYPGISVLVIDKQSQPGINNSCAGGISEGIVKRYNIPEKLLKRTGEYRIHSGKRTHLIKLRGDFPVLTTIKRENLDGYLYECALKYENIVFELSTNIFDVKQKENLYKVLAKDKEGHIKHYQSENIVFADGPRTLARNFGLGTRMDKKYYIAFSGYSNEKKSNAELIISKGDWGYLWYFPHVNEINIGYGTIITNKANYLKKIKGYKDKLEHFTSGLIPTKLTKKFYKKGLYVIGDAAGLVNPITGGGLIYSFISGFKAGRDLIKKKVFRRKTNFNFKMYFDKSYIWLFGMHMIFNFYYILYKIGLKGAYLNMIIFYFKLIRYMFYFTKSL